MLTPFDVLAPQGLISQKLAHYEYRKEQLEMSQAVAEAIASHSHLIVEAGTGVGKSFAYLIPALLYVHAERQERKERFTDETPIPRAVVSTHTISLQEQLISKDLPFLSEVLPFEFSAVLVKGRSNYLCRRRLEAALQKSLGYFSGFEQSDLKRIAQWAKSTQDGSLSDLSPRPNWEVWSEVCCESGNCLGSSCLLRNECFYTKARQQIFGAEILVVNHSLLFSDLALRKSTESDDAPFSTPQSAANRSGAILPPYDVLVFDEAHTMEQVAADHLGLSISQGAIDYNLNRLCGEKKGLLFSARKSQDHFSSAIEMTRDCQFRATNFFDDLMHWLYQRPGSNGRVHESNIVKNSLCEGLRKLVSFVRNEIDKVDNKDARQEIRSTINRISDLSQEINSWINQTDEGYVYWLETKQSRGKLSISAHSAPVDVGPELQEHLFNRIPSVILTSATLATSAKTAAKAKKTMKSPQDDHSFDFFKKRIGLTQVKTLLLGSPFDYENQATLVLVQGLHSPRNNENQWIPQLCDLLRRYLEETDGHAFVLFTSYSQMKTISSQLTPWLGEKKMTLLSQADGIPRNQLLEQFKQTPRSVLFGTDSFWQGVDVPGDSLQNVIITKLPFLVPNQPLTEARLERIKDQGGNPFMDYQLPHAIIKFKQGFGRLIRTKTDHGIVVLLDQRVHTKHYGRQFLDALPKCRMRVDKAIS